jgi:uncharacterized protein (TIGR02246 family)
MRLGVARTFSRMIALVVLTVAAMSTVHADDRSDVAAVSLAWKKAYNAGDVNAVSALYAEDAVLSAPGLPVVRGRAAIHDYFVDTISKFAESGLVVHDEPMGDVVTSCDLAWQWQTYRVVDRSGAVVDSGRLVTLFQRKGDRWLIAGDTWNSERPATY